MDTRQIASPLARKMAREQKIDLAAISGSGPDGRIIKRDVEKARAHLHTPAPTPAAAVSALPDPRLFYQKEDYIERPLSVMNKAIAKRLTQAVQELPHFYLTMALPLDALLAMRKKFNEALADKNEKLSVNDFIVRAAALALMEAPEVNVSFADEAILQHKHADIGVAVALPDGLITPIVPHAETLSLREISAKIKELAQLAAARKLKPSQYEGGSFSVSNLGMFGIEEFTAVINPPQAAILAVGAAQKSLARSVKGEIIEQTELRVTLSCDHRAINGAVGARFLQALRDYVAYPYLLTF